MYNGAIVLQQKSMRLCQSMKHTLSKQKNYQGGGKWEFKYNSTTK